MAGAESGTATIGKSVEIRGELTGSQDLLIDGHVEGTIHLAESRLTVGPGAHVAANVAARDVIIMGALHGNVQASGRVELRQGATLIGDLSAARLSIDENASFKGNVDLIQGHKAAAMPQAQTA
jgi:cytoskeletal protein CcmA (bactofilin family)